MAERIPEMMASLGLPLIRVEQRDNGLHYFYRDNRERERFFWTRAEGKEVFFYCGVSSSAAKMLEGLSAAGVFEEDEDAN